MTEMQKSLALFTGSVNPDLAEKIANELGVSLGNVKLETFSNGEIYARYLESVRGADVFLIQSVAGEHINDALMELSLIHIFQGPRPAHGRQDSRRIRAGHPGPGGRHVLRVVLPGAA